MASAATVKAASPVKTAPAAEAGASARRKAPFLSATAEAAEGARANAALAARLDIAATSSGFAADGTGANVALAPGLGIAASSPAVYAGGT